MHKESLHLAHLQAVFKELMGILIFSIEISGLILLLSGGSIYDSTVSKPVFEAMQPPTAPTITQQQTPAPTAEYQPSPSPTATQQQTPVPAAQQPPAAAKPPIAPGTDKAPLTDSSIYPVTHFKIKSPEACLTFDDGYYRKNIRAVLDALKKNDIRCTFFIIGSALSEDSDLWKEAISDGNQVCNHTQNHKKLTALSNENIEKEIKAWEATASKVLGEDYLKRMKTEFPYFRLPYYKGYKDKRVLQIIHDLGYKTIGWSVETDYAILSKHNLEKEDPAKITGLVAAYVPRNIKSGSIVLLHFNSYDTGRIDDIIKGIRKKNIDLKLVSDLLK